MSVILLPEICLNHHRIIAHRSGSLREQFAVVQNIDPLTYVHDKLHVMLNLEADRIAPDHAVPSPYAAVPPSPVSFMPAAGSSSSSSLGIRGKGAGDFQPALFAVREASDASAKTWLIPTDSSVSGIPLHVCCTLLLPLLFFGV